MGRKKAINVGLMGCGTVGTGFADLLLKNKPCGISLETIVVRDIHKKRKLAFSNFTTDVDKVVENSNIDVVVELIGGYSPAKEYILKAIKNGKHVITANKAVISEYGLEIFEQARKYGVNVGFEGAVAGGIPIINPLLNQLSHGEISGIAGILNGTSNFILTRMGEGMSYDDALKIAQQKGYAESNPKFDVGGIDAAQKISILASLAFGSWIKPSEVYCEGITEITPIDVEYASELGYAVKLLAIAKKTKNNEIDVRVHPTLISKNNRLANVNDEFNAIHIQGSPFDEYLEVGKGAGQGPTSFSVYYDLILTADMIRNNSIREIKINSGKVKIADQNKIATEGYLRTYLLNVPGSLYKVLGVLAKNKWNIKDSIQRGSKKYAIFVDNAECLPDIITHEPLPFGVIKGTLPELKNLRAGNRKPVYGNPFYMRILEDV